MVLLATAFNLTDWLLQQAPVIVVMGTVIWWLQKRLTKRELELKKVSEKTIELATKWELKADTHGEKNRKSHEEIMKELIKIKSKLKISDDE